jgi:hypothetical protein
VDERMALLDSTKIWARNIKRDVVALWIFAVPLPQQNDDIRPIRLDTTQVMDKMTNPCP